MFDIDLNSLNRKPDPNIEHFKKIGYMLSYTLNAYRVSELSDFEKKIFDQASLLKIAIDNKFKLISGEDDIINNYNNFINDLAKDKNFLLTILDNISQAFFFGEYKLPKISITFKNMLGYRDYILSAYELEYLTHEPDHIKNGKLIGSFLNKSLKLHKKCNYNDQPVKTINYFIDNLKTGLDIAEDIDEELNIISEDYQYLKNLIKKHDYYNVLFSTIYDELAELSDRELGFESSLRDKVLESGRVVQDLDLTKEYLLKCRGAILKLFKKTPY